MKEGRIVLFLQSIITASLGIFSKTPTFIILLPLTKIVAFENFLVGLTYIVALLSA